MEGFYLCHGKGVVTLAVLGMQPMLRGLQIEGLPKVLEFEWQAECFDEPGRSLGVKHYRTKANEELVFDSKSFFSDADSLNARQTTGYVRLTVGAVVFEEEPSEALTQNPRGFNGVFACHRPGGFITGVHMYHGITFYPLRVLVRHYVWRLVKYIIHCFRRPLSVNNNTIWQGDAVGAVAVHATASLGGAAIAVMHNDNWYPGLFSRIQFRGESGQIVNQKIPNLRPGSTCKIKMEPRADFEGSDDIWAQALCIDPPLGMSRFLSGEEFPDGSFTLDHSYFQQPIGSTWGKEQEVRFFPRHLLDHVILGPTNPWYCAHDDHVHSLVAISNQFNPNNEYRYDLLVFSESGQLVLRQNEFCVVPPWGFAVPSISDALTRHGISNFRGTYVLAYSATNQQELLPSRMHVQGIYHFRDGFWNGVQSDSSIWSTPEKPIPEIEALSPAKVRRRQLWYAPVVEDQNIETLITLANLSYSLDYAAPQTLTLRYCRGADVIAEKNVLLQPFGSALIGLRELFGEHMAQLSEGGREYGEVMVYPKTGKTYCASYMIRDRASGKFFLEHHLSVPKFSHER
jgi:hypothetical protein